MIETGPGTGWRSTNSRRAGRWVRWIFERYVEGWGTKRIAHELNARGVHSARGGTWPASALRGRIDRATAVLNNELYIGRSIWNRLQWVRAFVRHGAPAAASRRVGAVDAVRRNASLRNL